MSLVQPPWPPASSAAALLLRPVIVLPPGIRTPRSVPWPVASAPPLFYELPCQFFSRDCAESRALAPATSRASSRVRRPSRLRRGSPAPPRCASRQQALQGAAAAPHRSTCRPHSCFVPAAAAAAVAIGGAGGSGIEGCGEPLRYTADGEQCCARPGRVAFAFLFADPAGSDPSAITSTSAAATAADPLSSAAATTAPSRAAAAATACHIHRISLARVPLSAWP